MGKVQRVSSLVGFDTAPRYFVNGIEDIRPFGVNAEFVIYSEHADIHRSPFHKCEFLAVVPIGNLFAIRKKLLSFMSGLPHAAILIFVHAALSLA
jgi:hypothetical protein